MEVLRRRGTERSGEMEGLKAGRLHGVDASGGRSEAGKPPDRSANYLWTGGEVRLGPKSLDRDQGRLCRLDPKLGNRGSHHGSRMALIKGKLVTEAPQKNGQRQPANSQKRERMYLVPQAIDPYSAYSQAEDRFQRRRARDRECT